MHPSDDRNRVEFLDADPVDGVEEELEQPAEHPWLRRARLPLLVAAAVALVAVLVVSVVSGSHGTPSAGPATVTATPHPSRSASTSAAPGVVLHLPPHRSVELPGTELTCAINTACAVDLDTPDAVRAAVRDAEPKAVQLHTVTVSQTNVPGGRLSSRQITARIGVARLSIVVQPAKPTDRLFWNAAETAARTSATARTHVDGRLVVVMVAAPPGHAVDIGSVRRLAADPRLLQLG